MDAGVSDDHADGALTLQPHVTIRPRRQNNLQLATLLKRIDAQPIKDHDLLVKRRLSFLLLLGALLGLMAQEAAFASAPAMPTHDISMAASAMSDECAEMMGIDKSEGEAPCKGLTLDCIAKMGVVRRMGHRAASHDTSGE